MAAHSQVLTHPRGASVLQTAGHPHPARNQFFPKPREQAENNSPHFEVIDAPELARRLCVPTSWIREQTRSRSADPIPHLDMGRYVRFEWGSPQLAAWLAKRRSCKG